MRQRCASTAILHTGLAVLACTFFGALRVTAAEPAAPPDPARAKLLRKIPRHPSMLVFPPRVVSVPDAAPFVHRLSDGTTVVLVEDDALPLVRLTLALPASPGPSENPALAGLAAAMMRRGGTAERTPGDLDEAADYLGAEIDAQSGVERSVATLDCLASTLDEAADLFFEMLREPAFDPERFEQLRDNLLASLAARNDSPIDVMERELGWLLFGRQSPRVAQPTASDVMALSRDELATYYRHAWRPERAVLALSGTAASGEILARLETELDRWGSAVGKREGSDSAPPGHRGDGASAAPPGLYWASHASPQAKVSLALRLAPLPSWDARRAAELDLVNEILGGTGLLSRLGGRLRSREGLVYRVLSEVEIHPGDPGLFRIFLDTGTEDLPKALTGVVEEIERLRRDPVSAGELEPVRQELLSRLARRFDSAEEIAGYFAQDILVDRPHSWWTDYVDALEAARPSDVRQTALDLLDPAALIVVVVGGPATADELRRLPAGHRLVRTWLREAEVLPARDPLTLEPVGR